MRWGTPFIKKTTASTTLEVAALCACIYVSKGYAREKEVWAGPISWTLIWPAFTLQDQMSCGWMVRGTVVSRVHQGSSPDARIIPEFIS